MAQLPRDEHKSQRESAINVRMRDYIPSICLISWYVVIVGALLFSRPLVYLPNGEVIDVTSPLQRELQYGSSVFIVIGVIAGFGRLRRVLEGLNNHLAAVLAALAAFSIMAVFAVVRGSPLELANVGIFLMSLTLGLLVWTAPAGAQRLVGNAIFLASLGVLIVAILIYGLPKSRWIGGIHPNLAGFLAVVVATYAWLRRSALGYLLFAGAVAFSVAISSRYAILLIILVALCDLWIRSSKRYGLIVGALIWVALPGTLLLFTGGFLSDIFLLNDATRGVESGGSGRLNLDAISLDQLPDHFLMGAGFRNRLGYSAAHNGFINLLNETGIFVFALFVGVFFYASYVMVRRVMSSTEYKGSVEDATAYLFLAALGAAMFQPQLVNFGDSQGAALILGLSLAFARKPREYRTMGYEPEFSPEAVRSWK